MTSPPDWVTKVPATPAVHNQPAGYQWQGLTQQELEDLRRNLIESIVSAVMEVIVGFVPFGEPAIDLLGTFFGDLLGLLGDPLGLGTGSPTIPDLTDIPILGDLVELSSDDMIDQLISLGGLLGIDTWIPPHLLAYLSPGTSRNILPDPDFADGDYLDGDGMWVWVADTMPGSSGGSVQTVADGNEHILYSKTAWPVTEGQAITVGAKVEWSGVTATGTSFGVGVDVFDAADQYVATVSSAATTVSDPAASGGPQELSDTLTIPAGVSVARLALRVFNTVTAGTVSFDAADFTPETRVDAGLLGNIDELPLVQDLIDMFAGAGSALAGLAGLTEVVDELMDILSVVGLGTGEGGLTSGASTIGSAFDGIINSIMAGLGVTGGGHSVADVANALGDLASTTADAVMIAQNVSFDWGMQAVNNPMHHGIDPSLHGVYPLTSNMTSSATTIDVVAANSKIGFINVPVTTVKNSVVWLGYGTANITAAYVSVYKADLNTQSLVPVWSSGDVKANLSSDLAWTYVSIDEPLEVAEGEWYGIELSVTGAGTHTIVGGANHWIPAHPTRFPSQLAATRSSPTQPATTITNPTYSGNVPWLALSSADIDSGGVQYTHAPETTAFATVGDFVYTWPSWANYVDCVGVGGGGSGQGEVGINMGQGGGPGAWNAVTLQRGEDVALNVSQLDIHVGAGGAGVGYFGTGNNGDHSSVQWYDNSNQLQTCSCPGGDGGSSNSLFGYGGGGAGDYVFNGVTYHGGSGSVINLSGNPPGGGGGGAAIFVPISGSGARGQVWCVARQY